MESVVVTYTTGGRVCLKCSLYSFSTDTGCTQELISSGSLNYRNTFNRRGNTAKGCVSGVTAGVYDIRVYDSSSSELLHRVNNVTVLSLTTISTTTSKVFLPHTTSATVTNTSSESQSENIIGCNNIL